MGVSLSVSGVFSVIYCFGYLLLFFTVLNFFYCSLLFWHVITHSQASSTSRVQIAEARDDYRVPINLHNP